MSEDVSVTQWLKLAREGDEQAIERLWSQYFDKLVRVASSQMGELRRAYDGEDAALSAMNSFFQRIQHNQFPDLENRQNLWKLLAVMTRRKVSDRRKYELEKRGRGQVRGKSVFYTGDEQQRSIGIADVISEEPTPEFALQLVEQTQTALDRLDGSLREVAELKINHWTNAEIAGKLGLTLRSVQRKLERIRTIWEATFG